MRSDTETDRDNDPKTLFLDVDFHAPLNSTSAEDAEIVRLQMMETMLAVKHLDEQTPEFEISVFLPDGEQRTPEEVFEYFYGETNRIIANDAEIREMLREAAAHPQNLAAFSTAVQPQGTILR